MGTVGIQQILAVLDTVEFGILAIDHKDRIILCNRVASGFLGLKNRELLGKPIQSIIPDSQLPQVRQEGIRQVNQRFSLGDKCFMVNRAPVKYRGGLSGAVVWLQDVADVEMMSQELESVKKLKSEISGLRQRQDLKDEIVSLSGEMQEVLNLARRVAVVDSTVLLLGESGVGKDLVAKLIHWASPRSLDGGFVKLNCGDIPGEVLELELFGYEGGEFLAARNKPGYFELAHGGTLFLDEIAEIPPELQLKLLRVLQDREVTRLGATNSRTVDVRLIAATSCNLRQRVSQGLFREDLYYRLTLVPIEISPLRERREDIPGLLLHFINRFNKKYSLKKYFSTESIELLSQYQWPGNVRELANMVERMVVTTSMECIMPEDLPLVVINKSQPSQEKLPEMEMSQDIFPDAANRSRELPLGVANFNSVIEDTEKQLIELALRQHGTTRKAAEALGMSQSTFSRKVRKYLLNNRTSRETG